MIQSILIVQKFFYSILNNLEGYTTYNSTFLQFIGQYCCGWQDVTEILFPCGIEVVRMIMWVNAHKVTQNRDMTLISPWLRAVSGAGPLYMSHQEGWQQPPASTMHCYGQHLLFGNHGTKIMTKTWYSYWLTHHVILMLECSLNTSAWKSSIRRFVITENAPTTGLLLVESGYYRFHI